LIIQHKGKQGKLKRCSRCTHYKELRSVNYESNPQTILMDYFSATIAKNIFLRTGEGKPVPPNLYEQNSLLRAPKYQDTHSFGMFFVNTVTIT